MWNSLQRLMPWLAGISYTDVGTSRHPLKKGHHISFSHHHPESAHTPWPQGRSTAAQGMQNVFIQGVIFISLGCQYPVTFQQPKNYLFLGTIFWTGSLSSTFAWFNFSDSVCLSPDPLQVLKSQFFPAFGKGWFFSIPQKILWSLKWAFLFNPKQTNQVCVLPHSAASRVLGSRSAGLLTLPDWLPLLL